MTSTVRIKRVYEPPETSDGTRVLVDRVWPRGLSKKRAAVDVWLKEIAPSSTLRKWFGHDPARWKEFERRYGAELAGKGELLGELRALMRKGRITLLFGAHDTEHNNAVALAAHMKLKRSL